MEGISLYIHIPFCKQKCRYCDFPSYPCKENLMEAYIEALCKEIQDRVSDKCINTIFIGGGTPTYLNLEAWERLGKRIEKLNKTKKIEFTVEGNPGTFTKEKLQYLKSIGVNRISMGLQAWQDNLLKSLGRIHSRSDFMESYKLCREIGFKNINIDLMFGLPNQSFTDWKETLKNVVNMSPEHVSCYSLIIEEGTPFYKIYEKNELSLPSEELERQMYEYCKRYLDENGYKQYEISNYAKPGYECKHNIVYWDVKEYIGCGSSSHSYLNSERVSNEKDIERYIKQINDKGNAMVSLYKNSKKDNIEEFMFMGLRKINGISKIEFYNRFGITVDCLYKSIIDKYKGFNLIKEDESRIYLTEEGINISNSIMSEFILDK